MTVSNKAVRSGGRVIALLGPTNTGKTYQAIEEMMSYESGVIGFPLRLLARENYDRMVALKGRDKVALITGEEKIIPPRARYYSCTVESMPVSKSFEFLAVDEIQLCADPERGHIFTDRLLRARGSEQTMFMGAETMRSIIEALVPGVEFLSKARLSLLTYKGFKKLSRMPKRSAIVAFSVNDVYAIAELIRRQRGGTAVVLGALSPRTRNKQVEMYQSGEVDFLVATDAIGMGLNMDIRHVALAGTRKFDGQRMRSLGRAEIGQVAGRAGRYRRDGTFGVTGSVKALEDDTVEAVETHVFEREKVLCWRNSYLDFSSPSFLLKSLELPSGNDLLSRGRPADDYMTLSKLAVRDDIRVRATGPAAVQLLWDVCKIPDFRKSLSDAHQDFIAGIYYDLIDGGRIPAPRIEKALKELDRPEGDVDALMNRIAHVRTWTYITHKPEWTDNAQDWEVRAREIEDRLSDALHEALTKRFVDRRAASLLQAMDTGRELLAGIRLSGEVVVEGHAVGRLDGLRFFPDDNIKGMDGKAVLSAARQALKPEIRKRIKLMLNAKDEQFKLLETGQIAFQREPSNPLPGEEIARIVKGESLLSPGVELLSSELVGDVDKVAIVTRLQAWLQTHIQEVLKPLFPLKEEEAFAGTSRGIAYQLYEALGIIPRAALEEMIAGLDEEGRAALRKARVRMGPVLIYLPELNKPAAVRLRAMLWALWNGKDLPAAGVPADGMTSVSIEDRKDLDFMFFRSIGYPVYGPRAIRVDMLDRLVCAIYDSAEEGKFKARHEMAEWLGCSIPDLYKVLESLGHVKIYDPADEAEKPEGQSEGDSKVEADSNDKGEEPKKSEENKAEDVKAEKSAPDAEKDEKEPKEAAQVEASATATATEKPELATFHLRRGKAYGNKGHARNKPSRKQTGYKGKQGNKGDDFKKGHKKGHKKGKRQSGFAASAPQQMSHSPFAVLKELTDKKDSGDKKKSS